MSDAQAEVAELTLDGQRYELPVYVGSEGERAIDAVRTLNGVTDSAVAAPGTIRGDFSLYKNRNLVHASDAPDSAAREIGLWFPALEV